MNESSYSDVLQNAMIWSSSVPTGQRQYVAFRKTFDVSALPQNAELRIFADTRYLLWINGCYVERGPCRFNPKQPEYDVLDVKSHLHEGRNVIAVLVHHYGGTDYFNSHVMAHEPGLTVRLDITGLDGSKFTLLTGPDWRVNPKTSYQPDAEHSFSSHRDKIDARISPGDWTQTDFDDSEWASAVSIDGQLWGKLSARSIPLLREMEITPEIIVQETIPSCEAPSGKIRKDIPQHISRRFPLAMKKGHEIILDIGKTAQAYSILDFDAEEGAELEVQYALRFFDTDRKPTSELNDAPNRYIARAGRQTYMSTDTFGCKYVVISVTEGAITLHSVKMVNRLYPYARAGRFVCSDPVLTGLWRIGANTVEVCSEDAYVDCIDRERSQWIADGYLMGFTVSCAALAGPGDSCGYRFMDPRLLRNIIRHVGLSQLPDGRLKTMQPSNQPADEIHAVLDDYSCLWVQAVREYYDMTGDTGLVREVWTTLVKAIEYYLGRKTDHGLVLAREFTYPHNPLAYKTCEGATFNAYLHRSLLDGAYLGRLIGETPQAEVFEQAAKDLYACYNEQLWDVSSGSYYGSIMEGEKTEPTGHAAMLALYYDLVPVERQDSVFQFLLDHWKDGFPYAHYFYLHVLYRQNRPEIDVLALNTIRKEWAQMLNYETETTSESFGGGSFAHEAGAVPTYFLSRFVLGVRCEGMFPNRRILIEPRLGDLRYARGTVLTDFGPVNVSWKKSKKSFVFLLELPPGSQADVALPISNSNVTMTLNEEVKVEKGIALKGFILDSQSIRFTVESGTCKGTIIEPES